MDYKNSGVDIEAGYKSVELMKKHVQGTMRPEVLTGLGGFSGAFSMESFKNMEKPTLVSGTDGVGNAVGFRPRTCEGFRCDIRRLRIQLLHVYCHIASSRSQRHRLEGDVAILVGRLLHGRENQDFTVGPVVCLRCASVILRT